MKTRITLAVLAVMLTLAAVLLTAPAPVFANHDGDQQTGCCKDGSSLWASQSKGAWRPNTSAGFQGSDLPPISSGFNPHDLDRYDNPRYSAPSQPQQEPPSYNYNDPQRFTSGPRSGGGSQVR